MHRVFAFQTDDPATGLKQGVDTTQAHSITKTTFREIAIHPIRIPPLPQPHSERSPRHQAIKIATVKMDNNSPHTAAAIVRSEGSNRATATEISIHGTAPAMNFEACRLNNLYLSTVDRNRLLSAHFATAALNMIMDSANPTISAKQIDPNVMPIDTKR